MVAASLTKPDVVCVRCSLSALTAVPAFFVEDVPAFDLLCGTDQVRKGMEAGWPLDRLMEGFEAQARDFAKRRERHLLYAQGS